MAIKGHHYALGIGAAIAGFLVIRHFWNKTSTVVVNPPVNQLVQDTSLSQGLVGKPPAPKNTDATHTNFLGFGKSQPRILMTTAQARQRPIPAGMVRCCAVYGTNDRCRIWEDRPIGSPCGGPTD